ncbi:phosphate ABC transporter substrate-binding protein PstS [Natronoflexus pectinivorans]|uniref:Phosphate-binding protein n=1 Tax=Natronoflexus pectinivorans TaxID=682526 RepID=A0A4R2GNE7_9BACT|nr:phosphate ABC transporter substrate-binding protein PstS [Natronoflexus pectinivorans]TCO10834.1 phosphate transport system substrate-binding protein [Natronoflexus pectinivorans]
MQKRNLRNLLPVMAIMLSVAIFSACGGRSGSESSDERRAARAARVDVLGAGASFPAPLVTAMADEYRQATANRVTINYQSIGSGGGIRQFVEQTIMFGMSEAFLSDEVMTNVESSTGGRAFNMPITLADVVATYNLPGISKGLIFNSEVLVEIYLGKITRWNDAKIKALNPDQNLPNLPITVVHRSDGSGTTNIWTSYFSRVSDEWRDRVGMGTSVNWPVGVGGNGNEGVAGAVQNTPGAIGYNSLSYALLNNMSYGYVINAAGNVIPPSFAATTEAANIELPADTRILFTNTPAPQGYPIAGFAWMLVYENLDKNNAIANESEAVELIEFLIWAITDGQELSEGLGYARLPQAAIDRNFEMIKQLKWNGEKIGEKVLNRVLNS